MSMLGNIGAEAAAKEILGFVKREDRGVSRQTGNCRSFA